MLYDVESVRKKALRLYESGELFRSFVEGKSLFPFSIKLKTPTQKGLRDSMSRLSKEFKALESLRLEINYQEFDFKSIGKQRLPVSVEIKTQEVLLRFLGKTGEFEEFVRAYREATESFCSLKILFLSKPNLLLQNRENIAQLLAICKFFVANPKPHIYIRELSIEGVDTKFIQKNSAVVDSFLVSVLEEKSYDAKRIKLSENGFEKKYGLKYELPLVRFRILDSSLYIQGLSDLSLTTEEFVALNLACDNVFIVENKITMLSFMELKNSIVIFGNGYGAGRIKNARWLEDKKIYYWGDIDLDGFAILSQVRGYFPQTQSLLMDNTTIEQFQELAVDSRERSAKKLEYLSDAERVVYERLVNDYYGENFRLEQERIPFSYVQKEVNLTQK